MPIIRFYAPWCGHCQNLKPAYEKAAKSLSGLAKVAALNCDEEANKPFCGSMGVQGFPTLKIIRPGKKPGRPSVEDYQGARTAKAIVEAVKEKIPNHVKKISDKTIDDWLEAGNSSAKAILFTEKGTASPLLKALAVDFLGSISVGQVRDRDVNTVATFGITSFPTLILLPGGTKEPIVYDGELTKEGMTAFLSQVATPNPDPAPKPAKASKSKDSKKSAKAASDFSKASASHESADSSAAKATQTAEELEDDGNPLESPNPIVDTDESQKPIQLPEIAPAIPSLATLEELQQACLTKKSGTCILALLPDSTAAPDSEAAKAVAALSEIHHKHVSRGHKLFPFYSVSADAGNELRNALSIASDAFSLIATNAKRGWTKQFSNEKIDLAGIEDWVDAIRMGEGSKGALPEDLIVEAAAGTAATAAETASETPVAENDSPLGIKFEEITEEEKERLIQGAKEAANKAQAHEEL